MIITRQEAESKQLTHYFTGTSCRRGHLAARFVKSNECVECRRSLDARYHKENSDKRIQQSRVYKNKEAARVSAGSKLWKRNNPGKVAAYIATRRAALMQRTPNWANLTEIQEVYLDCQIISTLSQMYGGEPFEVDHIIPLQGDNVSGLHVSHNLQIIPASVNAKKHNKWEI